MLRSVELVIFLSTLYLVMCNRKQFHKSTQEIINQCNKKLKFSGSLDIFGEIPETREAKCFMACVFQERGLLKEDGTFELEVSRKNMEDLFENSKVLQAVTMELKYICDKDIEKSASDLCQTAYNFVKCQQVQVAGLLYGLFL